jgi:hypothetical protein
MKISLEYWWNDTDKRGNGSTGRKTCPSDAFSNIIITKTDYGSNPGLGDERPATVA